MKNIKEIYNFLFESVSNDTENSLAASDLIKKSDDFVDKIPTTEDWIRFFKQYGSYYKETENFIESGILFQIPDIPPSKTDLGRKLPLTFIDLYAASKPYYFDNMCLHVNKKDEDYLTYPYIDFTMVEYDKSVSYKTRIKWVKDGDCNHLNCWFWKYCGTDEERFGIIKYIPYIKDFCSKVVFKHIDEGVGINTAEATTKNLIDTGNSKLTDFEMLVKAIKILGWKGRFSENYKCKYKPEISYYDYEGLKRFPAYKGIVAIPVKYWVYKDSKKVGTLEEIELWFTKDEAPKFRITLHSKKALPRYYDLYRNDENYCSLNDKDSDKIVKDLLKSIKKGLQKGFYDNKGEMYYQLLELFSNIKLTR